MGPIDDCYALNVDGDCAWACYYSDFPVVLIRGDRVTGWHNDVQGAKALAVAESRVALFGGYGPDYDRLAVTALDGDRARPAGEYRIVLPDGEELPAGAQVVGREDRLHVLIGTSWYQLAVGDIPATRPPGPRYRRTWPCGARCACTATLTPIFAAGYQSPVGWTARFPGARWRPLCRGFVRIACSGSHSSGVGIADCSLSIRR